MSDELKHFGVKGQKWGVRRPLGSDGLILPNSKTGRVKDVVKKAGSATKKAGKKAGKAVVDNTVLYKRTKYGKVQADSKLAKKMMKTNPRKLQKKFSGEEIAQGANRVRLENNLKRLAKDYGDRKDKSLAKNVKRLTPEQINKVNTKLQNIQNFHTEAATNRKSKKGLSGSVSNSVKSAATDITLEYIRNAGQTDVSTLVRDAAKDLPANVAKDYYGKKSTKYKTVAAVVEGSKKKK